MTMNAESKKQIAALKKMRLPELQAKFKDVVGEASRSPNRTFLIRRITKKLTAADEPAAPESIAPLEGAPIEGAAEEGGTEGVQDPGPEIAQEAGAEDPGAGDAGAGAEEGVAEGGHAEVAQEAGTEVAQETRAEDAGADDVGAGAEESVAEEHPTTRGTASGGKAKPLSQMTVEQLSKLYAKVVGRPTSSTDKAYLIWKIREARKGRVPVGPRRKPVRAEPGEFMVLPFRLPTRTVERLDKAYQRHAYASRTDFLRAAVRALLTKHGEADVAALFEPQEKAERAERSAARTARVRAAAQSRARGGSRGRASGGRRAGARGR
jgi:Arc/MetJ-type ribon-helix-helix transcriptional regulator